jgi:hypothetical protein
LTAVQKARLAGFNVSLSKRGVTVVIQPGAVHVPCLVEPVDEHTRKRLQIADDLVTHIVHISRDALAQVDCLAVCVIERQDAQASYRVQHFKDDPQRPAVLFHCVLS